MVLEPLRKLFFTSSVYFKVGGTSIKSSS
jgi:hypothetical protein